MKEFYIFSNGRIKRKENTIYFEKENGEKKAIPVENIEGLHLFGEIDINTKALNFLSQQSIPLHIYNYYGFYSGSFMPRDRNVSGDLTVKQVIHYLEKEKRIYLAKSFVEGAIFHIIRNLRHYREMEESIKRITKEYEILLGCNDVFEIMGCEGRVRDLYYQSFNYILKGDFYIEKREKRPPKNPVNAMISFGNSLLYSTVLSQIYQVQLNPTISYLHQPSEKRYSLCLDIAEVFKPIIVDTIIFKLVNNNMIRKDDFDEDINYCYLNENGRKLFLKEYDQKLQTTIKHRSLKRNVSYKQLIKLECYKLIKHFLRDKLYKPFKAWW